jgi:Domain of unknown function (DUF3846)
MTTQQTAKDKTSETPPARALLISATGEVTDVQVSRVGLGQRLADMQRYVGGLIQPVDFAGSAKAEMWVNESGILMGMQVNEVASRIAGQGLVGPCLVMGPQGDGMPDLDGEIVTRINALSAEHGAAD